VSRANIKCDTETRHRLHQLKRDRETWDELLTRLAEYGELVNR
jgi:hypothetical protein